LVNQPERTGVCFSPEGLTPNTRTPVEPGNVADWRRSLFEAKKLNFAVRLRQNFSTGLFYSAAPKWAFFGEFAPLALLCKPLLVIV
jgi:hypothetical protein